MKAIKNGGQTADIDYRKWSCKLRKQLSKTRAERDRLSDELTLLQSKNESLKSELSENKIYTSKQVLEMMSEQAKTISKYAQMVEALTRENFELKRQKNTT